MVENTVTCAHAIDTSINGQCVCVSVCIAGEGGECHEEQQVAAQAALFGQERQNGVGRVLGEKGFQSPACYRHHLEIISSFYSHNYYVNVLHTDCAFLLRT